MINDPRIENLTILLTDVTALGHCVRGSRRWFEHYGFDFKHVIAHGVPAKDLVKTGDAQALAVVRAKLDALKGDE